MIFRAIRWDARYRPTVAFSRSLKRLRQFLAENPGYRHIPAAEWQVAVNQWARTGGQPNIVIDIDKEAEK